MLTGAAALSVDDIDAGTSVLSVTLSVAHGIVAVGGDVSGLSLLIGNGSATVSLMGTLTALNNALSSVSYTPTANYTGADTLTAVADDQGNTGAGGPKQATKSISLTVNLVNDAPVNTVPGAQSAYEDTPKVFSAGNSNPIAVADGDIGNGVLRVTVSVVHGTLTVGGNVGGLATLSGNGTGAVSLTGTVAAINAALSTLTYLGASDYNGPDTLTMTTNDQQALAPANQTTTSTVALTVYAVNDAPVIAAPTVVQSANEDTSIVFSAGNGNGLCVSDVDANGGVEQVTLTAANGTLTLSGTAGLTFSVGSGSGDGSMTFRGTLTDINAALAGLRYTPTPNFNDNTTLTISVNDLGNTGLGGAKTATSTVNLTFIPVDDPPVNSVPGPQAADENSPFYFTFAGGNSISTADVDSGTNAIEVMLSVAHGVLTLGGTAGLSFTTGTGSGDAAMTFTGTLDAVNAALAALRYDPAHDYVGSDTLTITTDDQGNTGIVVGPTSATNTVPITVSRVNDTPTLTLPGLQTFAEDSVRVFSVANGNAIVVDDGDAGSGVVQVTLSAADGTLTLAATAGLTFSRGVGSQDADVTFTGTLAAVNAALDGLSFTPPLDFNGSSYLVVAVDDLGNNGAGGPKFAADYVLLDVTAVNDPPVLTGGTIQNLTVAEDSGTSSLGLTGVTFGPGGGPDEATQTLTYTVTAVPPASLGNIVLADGVTTVTASSAYSLVQLRGMQFRTAADANTILGGPATFTFTVTDDGTTNGQPDPRTLTESLTVTVTEVNDPPVRTAGSIADLTVAAVPTQTSLGLSDVDYGPGGGPDELSQTLTFDVTVVPPAVLGTVFLADGVTAVTAGASYSLNQIRGMQFTPAVGAMGTGAFTFTVTDNGTTNGVLDPQSLMQSLTITVTNLAPVARDDQYTSPVNTTLTVSAAAGLLANDSDAEGEEFSISSFTNPTHGALALNTDGSFSYVPVANFAGTDTFTYQVADANGSSNTATVTITITAGVNNPPQAYDQSLSTNENAPLSGTVTASDSDGDPLTYTQVSGPMHGMLTLNSNGTFVYTPASNYHGPDAFTFRAADGTNSSNTATVSLAILDTSIPVAVDQDVKLQANKSVLVTLTASDSDGDVLKYSVVAGPAHGTLTRTAEGVYVYVPQAGFRGADSFTFSASDGNNTSNTATVHLSVVASTAFIPARTSVSSTVEPSGAVAVRFAPDVLFVLASAPATRAAAQPLPNGEFPLARVGLPLFTPLAIPMQSRSALVESSGSTELQASTGAAAAAFWPWLREFSDAPAERFNSPPRDGGFWPWLRELTPITANPLPPASTLGWLDLLFAGWKPTNELLRAADVVFCEMNGDDSDCTACFGES